MFSGVNEGHKRIQSDLKNENNLKYDQTNLINEFLDLENIGIDPSFNLIHALVLVISLFLCFRVMAERKRPSWQ